MPAHCILYSVYKDDPRGSVPTNPDDDPQYSVWEGAIEDWIGRKKTEDPNWSVDFGDPPTEYDDETALENIPDLEILQPNEGEILTSRQLDVEIKTSSPRGIVKVTYKLDDRYVGVVKDAPFDLNYYARDFANGEHTLTVIAEDDIGSSVQREVKFSFDAGEEKPAITWVENNLEIEKKDFPRMMFLNYFLLDDVAKVRIYQEDENNFQELIFESSNFSDLFNNQINFSWNYSGRGTYDLIVELTLKNGEEYESDRLRVKVE